MFSNDLKILDLFDDQLYLLFRKHVFEQTSHTSFDIGSHTFVRYIMAATEL